MTRRLSILSIFYLGLLSFSLADQQSFFAIPEVTGQAVVVIPENWQSTKALLQLWERKENGKWLPKGEALPVRLGKRGLAWGIGLHPLLPKFVKKREGDGKAPAGIFGIGGAYGYAEDIPRHKYLKYHQVTEQDMWVEDSDSPHYNKHLQLKGRGPQNDWERKQQMRLNDHAHSLKLFIEHNPSPNAIPNAGSAIFFHIWRDQGKKPTVGCTTMAEKDLQKLIAWVDPTLNPLYILLPKEEYERYRSQWALP